MQKIKKIKKIKSNKSLLNEASDKAVETVEPQSFFNGVAA